MMPKEIGSNFVNAVKIGLQVLLVVGGLILTLLVLLHKGKGGGLSDMFGGGMSSTMSGSSVAERNLDRFTVAVGLVWGASIVGLGLLTKFSS
jgi:preprotein translocase subunit SecG